jgi:glyoxylase-like metal-dependent hydrolase (beta-lactamase superfamily II)
MKRTWKILAAGLFGFALQATQAQGGPTLSHANTLATKAQASNQANLKGEIYVFESDGNGFNTKTVFYDTGKEVIAFDAQFTTGYAEQAIAFLKSKTLHPITHLIITHPNPDKFNGAPAFQKIGAKVIASKATLEAMTGVHDYKKYYFVQIAKSFTDATYPALARVDQTFAGKLELKLEGGLIHLRELSQPGISSTQTVAYLPKQQALIVGDLVHQKAHAWLEGGIVGGNRK